MLVRGNLYPIARGQKSKSGKMPVTFINSYYGARDKDGLFVETTAVDCWASAEVAMNFKFGEKVDGLLDINGEITMLKEFSVGGKTYSVSDKGLAELSEDEFNNGVKRGEIKSV